MLYMVIRYGFALCMFLFEEMNFGDWTFAIDWTFSEP